MKMSVEEYIRSWPRGLIQYDLSSANRLPSQSAEFLRDIGLPKEREPEWCFEGKLLQVGKELYGFGKHFTTQLVLDEHGTVFEHAADRLVFLNSGVQEMAYCLTLRKQASRGRMQIRTEESFQQFKQTLREIDSSALAEGCYWAAYIEEVREEMLESRDAGR